MFRSAALILGLIVPFSFGATEAERHFLEKVKPLLESRCITCHGPDKAKGGLRMDSREALVKGGDSGPAILPGKPSESLLLQAVLHNRKDLEMPPKEKLAPGDVACLERWIREGAPWPAVLQPAQPAVASTEPIGDAWHDPRNPIVRVFRGQRLDLWSLQPVKDPVVPTPRHLSKVRNDIDRFILARLERAGLKPSPEADRRTLARRVYFNLTGLPPTPGQMEKFLGDRAPGAYERLVDELLNSRRYAEHMARQWLDVVRYSDSNGFDWDEYRKDAWRFRDYVIQTFAEDKPFNEFIVEQLAGDELVPGEPRNAKEQSMLIASGYLRLGPQDNSAPLFNEQARARSELMADLVDTTSSAFLGMTMACCRCHDHKYDPLSQADHFRMRAFFEGVKTADDLPLDLADEQDRIRKHNTEVEARLRPLQARRDEIKTEVKVRLRAAKREKLENEELAILETPPEKRNEAQKMRAVTIEKKISPGEKEITAALSEDQKKVDLELEKEIAQIRKEKREFTHGLLMTDAEGQPPSTRILAQGDYKQEREVVSPGFISALDPNPASLAKAPNPKTLGRRLTLARWIASDSNPLTARVLVNRIWQMHFGHGLVETSNDFGLAGARPSHPELLDWLATEFVRHGWSVKKLHRLIVTSATFRQESAPIPRQTTGLKWIAAARTPAGCDVDADNQLLWRQNLRRFTAEQLRDALLAVSGNLIESNGGPPVWPELPAEVLTANPAFLDDNAEKTKGWYPSEREKQPVRSIYLVQKRTVRVPFMETFDLPENTTSCARRNTSIVAPQAFSMLNSPLALDAAKSFAAKLESEPDLPRKVRRAYQIAFQREPDSEETEACIELAAERGTLELCRALLNLNEFVFID